MQLDYPEMLEVLKKMQDNIMKKDPTKKREKQVYSLSFAITLAERYILLNKMKEKVKEEE